jgi:hypothetical protein
MLVWGNVHVPTNFGCISMFTTHENPSFAAMPFSPLFTRKGAP